MIEVPRELVEAGARKQEAEIVEFRGAAFLTSDPTGLVEPDRYPIGFMGELAVQQVLRDHGIEHKRDRTSRRADRFDILSHGQTMNVVTSYGVREYSLDERKLMMPENKYKNEITRKTDGFIGVILTAAALQVFGFVWMAQFPALSTTAQMKGTDLTRYIPYRKLMPIEALLAYWKAW
jgi:hypothetical protein